jgi:hypothetical protein
MRIRALEVQTAQVQGQYNRNIAKSEMISALLDGGAPAVATPSTASSRTAAAASPTASTTPAPATPAVPAYRVGETGPAGGLIFYDKGNNSGGWRYLEAGPVETEFQAPWSVRGTSVDNLQETIGSGKLNTQLIVETFKKTSGEWDTAAQKCEDLVYRGFDDWFMPSKAELDLMYGNLKRKNLGDFKEEWYWTSSRGYSTGSYMAATQYFKDGRMELDGRGNRFYVRPVRQVVGP